MTFILLWIRKIRMINKYHAIKVTDDNIIFDSKGEHKRYCQLKLLLKAKKIKELEIHPKYPILINGKKICSVSFDFKYRTEENELIIEDFKGKDNPLSRLKRKMFEASYGRKVTIVKKS